MRLGTLFAAFAFCAMSAAHAAVTVIGNGLAHACYIAAEHENGRAGDEETCTTALENDPLTPRDRAATFVNRGVVRAGIRHYEAALADYEQAIAFGGYLSSPDLGVAYVDRASILSVMGRYREAVGSASKGLSLGTFKPEIAYYVRAVAEEELGDLKAAYLDYRQAVAIQPDFALAARQLQRFHVETRPADGT